ncbi:hypothetical protein [Psychrosphaera aquimarina]
MAHANKIDGMTPAAIALILTYLKRHNGKRRNYCVLTGVTYV